MGKRRKSAKKVSTRGKLKVPKSFKCPICGHPDSCQVKMDKNTHSATIECRICSETFMTQTTVLTEAVDVFTAWLDALEVEAAGAAGGDDS